MMSIFKYDVSWTEFCYFSNFILKLYFRSTFDTILIGQA